MNLAADLPVTLVVKAANQRVADQTVECVLGWTIRKLKQHLETVYPSKPKHHQQKLIYSGKLLADHLTLKEVLRQYDEQNFQHTVHLVCSPSVESLAQAGPSHSQSFTDKKSEPLTIPSQSSMSSNDTDGVRHRGSQSQAASAATSTTGLTNAGANPAMPVPGAVDDMGFPGMPGMAGMHMMGAAPGMGAPGYMYTPEQMAWMQQMYSQYMAQYMQYYGYQMPNPDQAAPPQTPAPQQAANPAPVNNAPANQNMRMNAQGGMEEDDEEEHRDWLDYIYVFFRLLVFVSVIYFYSSASRFLTVALGFLGFYLLQNGWWIWHRRQQQQQQPEQQQQQPEQQQPQQAPPPPPAAAAGAAAAAAEGENVEAQPAETQEVADSTPESSADTTTQQAPPPPPEANNFTPAILLRMLVTFFTSLVPAPPPAINAN